ncbi:AAA family ATPase [Cupriavidus necator]
MKGLVLLSGPVAVGKTTLKEALVSSRDVGFEYLRTGAYLLKRAQAENRPTDRRGLQDLGDSLDEATDYRWIVDEVALPAMASSEAMFWLVDAVRKGRQVEHFRSMRQTRVLHVHLTAPECVIRERYRRRAGASGQVLAEYAALIHHPNEIASRALITIADLVLDTSQEDMGSNVESVLTALARA